MGFIAKRHILNGVAIAQEVIHQTRKRYAYGFLLKLKFEKANDMIDWDCLLEVLEF